MRKFILGLVITLGSVLILLGIGIFIFNAAIHNPGSVSLPPDIADHALSFKQEGWRATDEFRQLHRQNFPLVAGAVGTYGTNREIKLWVGQTFFKLMAKNMVTEMRDKIAAGTSPFTPNEARQLRGHTVYALDGMGQKHFYFQSGNLIIWLASNEGIAEQALTEVLEYYP